MHRQFLSAFNLIRLIIHVISQIQHPRSRLDRFDLVITPRHDYYPQTAHAREQIPWFLRRWITPRDHPDSHVVCPADGKYTPLLGITNVQLSY